MKTTLLIVLGALGLVTVGCASTTTTEDLESDSNEPTQITAADGETDEGTDDLRTASRPVGPGGPDRDTCEAQRAGCLASCNRNASCMISCNRTYELCRGLPPTSGGGMALPPKPKPVPFCPEGEVRKCTLGPPPVCSCVPVTKAPDFAVFTRQ